MKYLLILLILFSSCAESNYRKANSEKPLKQKAIISLCNILENPSKFNGKTIHSEGTMLGGFEKSHLYDLNCANKENLIWVESDSKNADDQLNPYFTPDSEEYKTKGVIRVNIEFTGTFQFDKEKGFGHLGSAIYQIKINEIKSIESVPLDVPYP